MLHCFSKPAAFHKVLSLTCDSTETWCWEKYGLFIFPQYWLGCSGIYCKPGWPWTPSFSGLLGLKEYCHCPASPIINVDLGISGFGFSDWFTWSGEFSPAIPDMKALDRLLFTICGFWYRHGLYFSNTALYMGAREMLWCKSWAKGGGL